MEERLPDHNEAKHPDPFGAVKSYQISQLNTNISNLATEFANFKRSVVTRVELYLTLVIVIMAGIIVALAVIAFQRGN